MYKIYLIENRVNGMKYVGQTKRSVKARLGQHVRDSRRELFTHSLQQAIKEHGKDNFSIRIIDVADSKTGADIKENYWIKELGTMNNGYNRSSGVGYSGCGRRIMNCETGEIFESIVSAAKKYGFSNGLIRFVINNPDRTARGFHWVDM